MQNLVQIYNNNKNLIQDFLLSSLQQTDLNLNDDELFAMMYKSFPSLELLYTSDEDYIQNSQNIFRDKRVTLSKNYDRKHLVHRINDAFGFHEPYISTATNQLCVTVVCKTDTGYLFLEC